MNASFQNIDEYISCQHADLQYKLNELRKIISQAVPSDTKETIAYQMPTFRHHGNLIHFAQFKNHIGIYPGPDAIEKFQTELSSYKTSKGAIQIPNDHPLDKKLIQNIIQFNVEAEKDKKNMDWTAYRDKWVDFYEKMNTTIHKTSLQKDIKWGMEIYTFNGKNVVGWAGFKNFFSIWFYNGVFLEDKYNVLVTASEGKTKALRQWRMTNLADFDETKILEYINESIQTIRDGKEITIEKGKPKEITGILKTHLQNNSEFKAAFESLTPGRQKEYIEYIDEAKQEKTKLARMEKITPMILSKKGLNDKYKR